MVPFVIISWFLLVCHRLILYSSSTGRCIAQPGFYEKYDAYFEVVISGLCPPIIVLVLGCGLLRNVRQVVHRRVVPVIVTIQKPNGHLSSIHNADAQITTMLLLQSLVVIPSFFLYGAQITYSSVTEGWDKSSERLAWENVFIEFIRLGSYIFNATGFYICFITSRRFRHTFFRTLRISCLRRRTVTTNVFIPSNSMYSMRRQEPKPSFR